MKEHRLGGTHYSSSSYIFGRIKTFESWNHREKRVFATSSINFIHLQILLQMKEKKYKKLEQVKVSFHKNRP